MPLLLIASAAALLAVPAPPAAGARASFRVRSDFTAGLDADEGWAGNRTVCIRRIWILPSSWSW